jgi:hypothetical protein
MVQNSWQLSRQDYYGQARFVGKVSVIEPMAFLCKVYDAQGYYYIKTPKNTELEYEVDCLLHDLPNSRVQVLFRLRNEINCSIVWPANCYSFIENGVFDEGVPFSIATFDTGGPAIELLGISCEKLKNLRKRIWRLKPEFRATVQEKNSEILERTRNGYVETA